jgi:hypothetical protein
MNAIDGPMMCNVGTQTAGWRIKAWGRVRVRPDDGRLRLVVSHCRAGQITMPAGFESSKSRVVL